MKELEQIINKVTRLENMVSERDKAIEALRGKIREWEKKYNERESMSTMISIPRSGLDTIEVVGVLSKALKDFYRADLICGFEIWEHECGEYECGDVEDNVNILFNTDLKVIDIID